ncbi:MAG: ACT domain-containing protein [Candidatus Hadarchaeia archaeon]
MRVRVEMELEDTPGRLVEVLEPISKLGVNIQNVVHERDEKTPLGKVPVTLLLEVGDSEKMERIKEELEKSGAQITRIGEEEAVARSVVLLVGDIIETDIKNSVDRLNSVEGARISDLRIALGQSEGESSALVVVEATDRDCLKEAMFKLKEITEEKDLLLIRSLR